MRPQDAAARLWPVPDQATLPPTQLVVHGFAPGASFEGQLVGALERIASGGALRIVDALFVERDGETGELVAVDLAGDAAGGMVSSLLGFRLDPAQRRRTTERALAGGLGETLRELARALEPGAALAAVLVEHVWARALEDAVSRTGGTPVMNTFVEATTLSELAPDMLDAATLFARSG
jgi:hypothetical protein